MSSSVSTRAKISKQKSRQTKSKQESKSELDSEIPKGSSVKEVIQKAKRSSSLNKQDKVKIKESPQKSQSIDRSLSNRYSSQNISIKKSLVDTKKANIGSKKNTDSLSSSRKQNVSKNKEVKANSSSSQEIKTSEKYSRSPMKGPSGKTNIEIAKSFVRNARDTNIKKETKSKSSKNSSEKIKSSNSSKKIDEETERPRTSTIRKGPPEIKNGLVESNGKELVNQESFEYYEIGEKNSGSKSDDEDDKISYEEDFEDYDSDFEDSDTDSVSETDSSESISNEEVNVLDSGIDRNSVSVKSAFSKSENTSSEQKCQYSEVRKNSEKNFLQMSDRSFLSNKQLSETSIENKIIKPSHSFINFASAVEQEEKKKYSNKVIKRASTLLEIITLSDVTYNHLDIPPMKYDTFIRFFGKTDAKQVFVQTENVEDEEIQTDDIEMVNKWTQNPSNDNFGSGGFAYHQLGRRVC